MSGILVIQPLPGIGDMVWHLPLIHAVAAARGRPVRLLTKTRSHADRLLAGDPAIEAVLWLERERDGHGRHAGPAGLWRLAWELRGHHLDEVWILHHSPRYALAAFLAGIPARHGYGARLQRPFLNAGRYLGADELRRHPVERAERFRTRNGLPRIDAEPRLPVAEAARALARQRLEGRPRPWFALGLGASEPYKQWGAKRYAQLAEALIRRHGGSCLLLGGRDEIALSRHLRNLCGLGPDRLIDALDLPLDEAAALLAEADLYVGNDTGVLNMAAALGTAALGLFGASRPLTHASRIVAVIPPAGGGMQGIGVERVLAEAGKQLGNPEEAAQ